MTIKQGTILPTTGIGTGYLLVFIWLIIAWNVGYNELLQIPSGYLLLFIPALMQFSYKDFILEESENGNCYYRYRILFVIRFKKKINFKNYRSIVIRVMNKTYSVQQGVGPGVSIAEGTHREKYLAIVGYTSSAEKDEICKGKKHELDKVIKIHIQPLNIPVYMGAPKKGYEYIVE